MSYVVGIAGGTGAGKSAVVDRLIARLGGCVLSLDSYYLDRGQFTPEERRGLNYDEPAAIDVALLLAHVDRLRAGHPVAKPVYSFQTHTRTGEEPLAPADIMFVEGLFPLWWPELRSRMDVKIFVDVPADIRFIRRLCRDLTERGRTVDQAVQQYLATARSMHDRYVEPGRRHADVVVTNEQSVGAAAETIAAAIERARGAAALQAIGTHADRCPEP